MTPKSTHSDTLEDWLTLCEIFFGVSKILTLYKQSSIRTRITSSENISFSWEFYFGSQAYWFIWTRVRFNNYWNGHSIIVSTLSKKKKKKKERKKNQTAKEKKGPKDRNIKMEIDGRKTERNIWRLSETSSK